MQSIAKLLCETARSPFPKNNRLTEAGGPDASHSGGTHSVFYCQSLPQGPPGRPGDPGGTGDTAYRWGHPAVKTVFVRALAKSCSNAYPCV